MLKVVCTQPFNKHVQYGISFICVSGGSGAEENKQAATGTSSNATNAAAAKQLGAFKLKAETQQDNIPVGYYFNRRKSTDREIQSVSAAAELRSEKTLASHALDQNKKEMQKLKEKKNHVQRKDNNTDKNDFPKRNSLPGEYEQDTDQEDEDTEANRLAAAESEKRKQKELEKRREKEKERRRKEREKERAEAEAEARKVAADEARRKRERAAEAKQQQRLKYAAFNRLMDGVVFTISGFQNPLRGEIRDKACKMGARYKGDWTQDCTHLVCAFVNTPKYNQVKGKGKIVKKEWIEESYKRRTRLNWKKYSLTNDPNDQSEEEIFEESKDKPKPSTSATPSNHNHNQRTPANAKPSTSATPSNHTNNQRTPSGAKPQNQPSTSASRRSPPETNREQKTPVKQHTSAFSSPRTPPSPSSPSYSPPSSRSAVPNLSDEDTDDEIERIMKAAEGTSTEKRRRSSGGTPISPEANPTNSQDMRKNGQPKKQSKMSDEGSGKAKSLSPRHTKPSSQPNIGITSFGEDKENQINTDNRAKPSAADWDEAYEADTDKEESDAENAYDADTDIDDDNIQGLRAETDGLSLTTLADIFKGRQFLLKGFEDDERALLERYIIA